MVKARLPLDEALRLSELDAYEILDSDPEKEFDELVELLKQITNCPYVAISFIDSNRQWHKASIGLDGKFEDREISFCSHAILGKKPMIVNDALQDERFHDNPKVTEGFKIRFYAGAPILSSNGRSIGAVCAYDSQARPFSAEQERAIEIISGQVTRLLELRIRNKQAIRIAQDMLAKERKTLEYTIQAQEVERKAMGMELNENFAQVVAACLLYINVALESEQVNRSMVKHAKDELLNLLNEMRRLSKTYNPISFPVVRLQDVVNEFVQQYATDESFKIDVECNGNLIELPNQEALNIFRTMDAYLRLIRDRGDKANISIRLKADKNLSLEIKDDILYDKISDADFEIRLNAILGRIGIVEGWYKLERAPGKPNLFVVKFPFSLRIAC